MRTLFLFTALLFGFSGAVKAQAGADTTLVIAFEKVTHDYGVVTQNSDGTCEFQFTNKGKTPLILNNVMASCGCTVPEWTREPVMPGKTGSIKVKYNTNILGTFNKSITVMSNAVNPTVVLTIKGQVVDKLSE